MGSENNALDKRKIIEIIDKPKSSINSIKAKATQNLIKLLCINKKASININLSEIKTMTPQEIWCLKKEIDKNINLLKQSQE